MDLEHILVILTDAEGPEDCLEDSAQYANCATDEVRDDRWILNIY
jgi:hypothetical protein